MDIRDLVVVLLRFDALAARQWVADAFREKLLWSGIDRPQGLKTVEMAVAAGVVELLAYRAGQSPPDWTREVMPLRNPVYLVRAAASMPRLRRLCEQEGPAPLRRLRIFAPPDFLTFA